MKPTGKRKAEMVDLAAYKRAKEKITVQLHLAPLNPTRLTACVGFDEDALVTYSNRRSSLRTTQEKLRQWINYTKRNGAEIAFCRSVWKSYQFYIVILDNLIEHSHLFVEGKGQRQRELFSLSDVSREDLRYVKPQ